MTRRLVVEADGGSRGNPGPAGYGSVVRDADTGELLAETAEYIGRATNNVAEYRGLLAGLRAARALDPDASVEVRMDSKLVVEQMSGRWKIKHPDLRPLADEARAVFPSDRVRYGWVPRERNKHADRLANEAMDAGSAGGRRVPAPAAAEPAPAAGRAAGAPAPLDTGPGAAPAAAPGTGASRTGEQYALAAERPAAPGWSAAPDLGVPTTLVLLRHGETPLTPQKRFSGSGGSDPALSEKGLAQAARAADLFAARGTLQAVVSSPLLRCRQTAETVAGRVGLEVRIEEGLRETDFGAWEGLTFAEARDRYPDELDAWLASPAAAPPGGESFADTERRVAAARDRLLVRYPGRTVLVVSHVTPVKTLVRLALGAPPESLFRMELSAAGISAVQYYADGNASLRLFNDTGHLR